MNVAHQGPGCSAIKVCPAAETFVLRIRMRMIPAQHLQGNASPGLCVNFLTAAFFFLMHQNSRWGSGVSVNAAEQMDSIVSPICSLLPTQVIQTRPLALFRVAMSGHQYFHKTKERSAKTKHARSLHGEANIRILPPHIWPPSGIKRELIWAKLRVSAFNAFSLALTGTSLNFPPRFGTASLRYVQRTHLDRCPDPRDYLVYVHGSLRCRIDRSK